jgi:hypothetical protein
MRDAASQRQRRRRVVSRLLNPVAQAQHRVGVGRVVDRHQQIAGRDDLLFADAQPSDVPGDRRDDGHRRRQRRHHDARRDHVGIAHHPSQPRDHCQHGEHHGLALAHQPRGRAAEHLLRVFTPFFEVGDFRGSHVTCRAHVPSSS